MNEIIIEPNLKLIPYFPNPEVALKWYQDLEVCKQVDNIDHPYSKEMLEDMYQYLSTKGECYYIQFHHKLVGDVSLYHGNELAIVVSKEFQNQHIGRKCIQQMMLIAKEKGLKKLKANIYSFNNQSRRMFESIGFKQIAEEVYEYEL